MQCKVEICGVNTAKLKVLKNEETRALLIRAKNGDADARDELIAGNLRLVLSVIQRFAGRGENVDDLFQVGCIGLIKAIDNFDIDQSVRFSTYGVPTFIGWRNPKGAFPMTRREAIALAVRALNDTGRGGEAAAVLEALADELPLTRWSDAAIRDAVEQFILDHGRTPTATDFKRRGLPPHTVIERRCGMTLRRWLDENYPPPAPDVGTRVADINRTFTDDYLRLRPHSAAAFNAGRTPGTPCWQTVAKHNHTGRWRGLLNALSLPVFPAADRDGPTALRVRIHPHCDFRED